MNEVRDDTAVSTFWPWVVGLVLLALVLWVASELVQGTVEEATPAVETSMSPAAFAAWVRDSSVNVREDASADFARVGMQRLTGALAARGIGTRSATLHESVALLREDSASAATLQQAMLAAVEAMAAHGLSAAAVVDLTAARAAASGVREDIPVSDQVNEIHLYFLHMAAALTGGAARQSHYFSSPAATGSVRS